jgi:hypothetical protein
MIHQHSEPSVSICSSSCESDHINSNRQHKSVHFNQECYLKLYSKPTETDRANAWYTGEDLQQFKMNSELVGNAIRHGETIEGESMNFLGLDNQDRQKADLKLKRRYLTWDIVMDGQEEASNASPLEIAAQCWQVSEGSSEDAVRSATLLHDVFTPCCLR